ncbi:Swt1 family HEPN domain-containing protein [Thalassolituus oleivorans]|uniref:Swt1 family HEPN domain-containing protein n=1 Tax=Thalassolituus oleivorans TaxID=187493 RepID=UPI00042DD7F1|nr:Swt1 family HEPN domain-containing protein [Thalassolituus oleivorans]AHK17501.1 hypothetical protein R615_07340 [Thalassolituus oleivorans R6-15]
MDWKKAKKNDKNQVAIPERWLHLYYYEALNILFRFENSLRVFVYAILKMELKEKWLEAAISGGGCIKSETKKRIAQSKEHGYLGYDISSPMLFLNSGELIDIIASDAYWKHFASYFKASKSIVVTKLQEIGTIRNSLAHFRPIKEDDIDLIKQNTKHVLLEVEKCLLQLTSINTLVPTNSEEDWYKKIKPIGGNNISLHLFHSSDESWVRLNISYKIPTLQKNSIGDGFYSYKIGNLRTVELLQEYPALKNNCIYISESSVWGQLDSEFDINSSKDISIVFPKKLLVENLDEIHAALNEMVLKIDEESDLIENDSLARGKLIEAKGATAMATDNGDGSRRWRVSLEGIDTPLTEVSEVEFWGQRVHYENDFVSATSQYPWMPSTISDFELPF